MSDLIETHLVDFEIKLRPVVEGDLGKLEWFGGFPVGQIWIDFKSAGARDPASLWAFRVMEPFQERGLGRRLLAAAERVLTERDVALVEIAAERKNPAALRLYERAGYTKYAERMESSTFAPPGSPPVTTTWDLVILRKALGAPQR